MHRKDLTRSRPRSMSIAGGYLREDVLEEALAWLLPDTPEVPPEWERCWTWGVGRPDTHG